MPKTALTGSRIRDRRLALGLRQAELARRAGISASYLNLIEHNRRPVAGRLLADLAEALGCAPGDLDEAAGAGLVAQLREAAAARGGDATPAPEIDRAEEFAGRFPGWAALLAERHARAERLAREAEALSDRLAHDPHLSATLHGLLNAVTAIRASAAILAETRDLDAAWTARFLASIGTEAARLAEGAEALVRFLDAPAGSGPAARTPAEEVEAFFAAHGWHLAPLEAPGADAGTVAALIDAAPALATRAGAELARRAALRYLEDARRLPLATVLPRAAEPADSLAAALSVPLDAVLRRLALLPGREAGLVIADAAGAITFRRPVAGFALPRHGAACPLWPLFQAFARPMMPRRAAVALAGPGTRRFLAQAVALPAAPLRAGEEPLLEAVMLLLPDPSGTGGEPEAVGSACRICPRAPCPARREPSVLAGGG
jgi:transcriptional regulator with XRE-family HTH domain